MAEQEKYLNSPKSICGLNVQINFVLRLGSNRRLLLITEDSTFRFFIIV